MNKLKFLKVFNSPFKRPKLKWYFGEVTIGTPYFYPRRWRNITKEEAKVTADEKFQKLIDAGKEPKQQIWDGFYQSSLRSKRAVPKKIGFDFVGLGYKTKWSDTDYRFEWGPLISFVFFKWQIAVMLKVPHPEHYWVCWLTYENDTDNDLLDTSTRIKIAKEINPEVWTSSRGEGKKETICYWDKVLKDKWL